MARTVTARSLIVGVFRLLGITAQGEEPNAPELLEAFDRLNEMIDGWSTQRLTMRVTRRDVFDTVTGQASYTIGTDGTPDWTAPRPDFVETAALLLTTTTPNTEIPLSPLTEQAYQALAQKTLENSQPTAYRYELTMPNATFTLWPVPDNDTNDIVVYSAEALTQFATLTTSYTMAPGYVRALRYSLALELASEYGRQVDALIVRNAEQAVSQIKILNTPMMDLGVDPGLVAGQMRTSYNIYTDQG